MVHTDWATVYKMGVIEFLNICSFVKDYNLEVKRQNDKEINKLKSKR